jgi:hypothetical protein
MLTELCEYLKNWDFRKKAKKYFGTFSIKNGVLSGIDDMAQNGQYFRIVGSIFNDGVYQNPVAEGVLKDEEFEGAVWIMAVPKEVLALATEIEEWQLKYGGVNSTSMSPFQSESFKGYSYTKKGGDNTSSNSAGYPSWQVAFAARLDMWRKV